MKIEVHRQSLADALEFVVGATKNRSPTPLLATVGLHATGKTLVLTATDNELAIRWRFTQLDVHLPGTAIIPCGRLLSVLNSLEDVTVVLETIGSMTSLKSSHANFHLNGLNPQEYVTVDVFKEDAVTFEIEGKQLRRMLDQTEFCGAREFAKYTVCGVDFSIRDGNLTLAATDTYRLSIVKADLLGDLGSFVVPPRVLALLRSILVVYPSRCQIFFTAHGATFRIFEQTVEVPTVVLYSPLVAGKFPPYDEIIPAAFCSIMEVRRANLVMAIKQAITLTSADSRVVRLTISQKSLKVSSRWPDAGDANIEIPAKLTGEPIQVGVHPDHLLEYLSLVEAENVTVSIATPQKPILFVADPRAAYAMMPIPLS